MKLHAHHDDGMFFQITAVLLNGELRTFRQNNRTKDWQVAIGRKGATHWRSATAMQARNAEQLLTRALVEQRTGIDLN